MGDHELGIDPAVKADLSATRELTLMRLFGHA